MRTNSPTKRALLASQEYDFHARAEVQKDDGSWQNMSDLGGYDWLDSSRWSDGNDPPAMEGSITFGREHYDGGPSLLSLAPYLQSSALNSNDSFLYAPQIKGGRGITIQTAYTAKGVAPVYSDWDEVFNGYIHNPEWGGDDPIVTCNMRDIGGYLMSQWTEEERDYGVAIGAPFETVLQSILNANPSRKFGIIDLYTPVSPGTNLRIVKIPRKPILMALRDLAAEIGWDVKYRYDAAGQFRLTFFEPDRTKTVPDFTLTSNEYISIESMDWPTDDIRNKVEVTGYDGTTGALLRAVAEDEASQDEYGTKYMRLGQDFSSNINTQTEVDDLAAIILNDLSRPFAAQRLKMPFFWIGQTGDLVQVEPNMVHHDTALKLGIRQVDYEITRADGDTFMSLSEQIGGLYKEWLRREDTAAVPDQPPTITATQTPNAAYTTVDIVLTPVSPTGEKVTVYFRRWWDLASADPLYLCVSGVDNTPRFVDSGTPIGPADWFYIPPGGFDPEGFVQPLNDVVLDGALQRTDYAQAKGQRSGMSSGWLPIVLEPRPLPRLASAVISATQPVKLSGSYAITLVVTLTGGPMMKSVLNMKIVDIAAPIGDAILDEVDLNTGQTVVLTYTVNASAAEVLDKVWGAWLTPNSEAIADQPGIDGLEILITTNGDAYVGAPAEALEGAEVLLNTADTNFPAGRVLLDADDGSITFDRTVANQIKPILDPSSIPQFPGPGGAMAIYQQIIKTTGSLANNASEVILLDIAPTVSFQRLDTDVAAWVRVYDTLAACLADAGRLSNVDAVPGSAGYPLFDSITASPSNLILPWQPNVVANNGDNPRIGRFYMRVTNKSGATDTVTTTIRYLPLEGTPAVIPSDTLLGMLYEFDMRQFTPVADNTEVLSVPNTGLLGGNFTSTSGFGSGPKYKVNQINGYPAMKFTQIGGNSRHYNNPPAGFVTPTESHIFAVLKTIGGGSAWMMGPDRTAFPNAAGNVSDWHQSSIERLVGIPDPSSATFLYHSHSVASLWEAYVSLVQKYTNGVNVVQGVSQNTLGGHLAGGFFANLFEGIIGHWRFYSGPKTDDEILGIKLAMSTYWGGIL